MWKATGAGIVMLAMAGCASIGAQDASEEDANNTLSTSDASTLARMPEPGFLGQHFTTENGCVYSRTSNAGGPTVWHVLSNTRVDGCPNTISSSQ